VRTFVDHTGKFLSIPTTPKRIISLVPSITELLFDLGLHDRVVGITKFCVHPDEWFRTKPRVGGTKNLNLSAIKILQPDLIIANKEENEKDQIEQLTKTYPVFTTVVDSVASGVQMIKDVGAITNADHNAQKIADEISENLKKQYLKDIRTLYLIWKDPFMAAGGDTFISDMMEYAGFRNAIHHIYRYPTITEEDIKNINPEIILLSSEPYPFKEKHIQELQSICPLAKTCVVDGEIFSWYGSRMRHAFNYFNILHNKISAYGTA
jgi:ABC-type Fe3+-hydroxamate transport system substrate-binding protein